MKSCYDRGVRVSISTAVVLAVLATAGCKPTTPDPEAQAEQKAADGAEAETPPEVDADGADADGADADGADADGAVSEPIPKWKGDDRDPSWYHPQIIPGAKELANTGSDVTGAGSLSRVLRLELPADSTVDGCVDQLRQAVASGIDAEVPAAKALPDGRQQVTGTAPDGRYRYTLMCGAVEDEVIAFVGYYID